jgi:hypothetical protein
MKLKICGTSIGLWKRMKPALPITNASWINAKVSRILTSDPQWAQIRDEMQITIAELASGNPVGVLAVAVGSVISAIEVAT